MFVLRASSGQVLGAGESFVSQPLHGVGKDVVVTVVTDVPGTVYVEGASVADGDWDTVGSLVVPGAVESSVTLGPVRLVHLYFRVRYVNGDIEQSTMLVSTSMY